MAAFLGRRALWAAPVWVGLCILLHLWANAGAVVSSPLSGFAIMLAFIAAGAGAAVGTIYGRGLTDRIGFVGSIPTVAAGIASVLTVIVGGQIADLAVPVERSFYVTQFALTGAVGACGAVAKFTWADA